MAPSTSSGTPSGFNFDVFISYRQNDNRVAGTAGEGWVSEFVSHLTTELESMVKGGASIYFDSDPKHGLRETDQVNASLDSHLKSVIFIPVLSQTYCDTHSYAWTEEFIRFIHNSSVDGLGSTIKLHTGNVVSRVLPVCIHELDADDQDLVEKHLDGKLRAIPFVFKSAGVNRPLRAREDDPMKNINRTIYRDQINKLAMAVKEIIETVRKPEQRASAQPKEIKRPSLLEGLPVGQPSSVRSIAIFPLVFKSSHPEEEFLSQGFAEDLFGSLRQIRALRLSIHGLNSSSNGKSPIQEPTSPATMVLTGSMTVQEEGITVMVRLVQSKSETPAWQGEFHCTRDELFSLRTRIILEICTTLGIPLKENEKRMVQQPADTSPQALELYWKGRYHWRRRGNDLLTSLDCFQKAADIDPNFAQAFAGIANASVLLGYYEMIPFDEAIAKCRDASMAALNIDPTIIEAYYALAYVALCYEWSWPDAEHNFSKVFEINPNSPAATKKYRLALTQILCNFEEAETESAGTVPYFLQAYALLHKGKFEEGLQVAQIAMKKDPNSFMAQRAAGLCYLGLGYEKEAIDTLSSAAQISNRHPLVLFDLIGAYATLAHNEGAQEIMEEAMANTNALPAKINDYYFQPA
jgi:TolB-like protein/tetratricopeptide (TPR) repeat protein